jgi:hypothetical protein
MKFPQTRLRGVPQQRGLRCVTIELREREIDTLVPKGILKSDARNNKYAVRVALYQYFDRTFN